LPNFGERTKLTHDGEPQSEFYWASLIFPIDGIGSAAAAGV
jgi:hypothetical protein